jgi:hypothetical protein
VSHTKPPEPVPPPAPVPAAGSNTPSHALMQGGKGVKPVKAMGTGGAEERVKMKNLRDSTCVVCGVERGTFNTSQGK